MYEQLMNIPTQELEISASALSLDKPNESPIIRKDKALRSDLNTLVQTRVVRNEAQRLEN